MAKKKTEDKELKPKAPIKKEEVKKVDIPNTKWVDIILNGQTRVRKVGNETATLLIGLKKAKLA